MSAGRIVLGVVIIGSAAWVIYRVVTGKPIVPQAVEAILKNLTDKIGEVLPTAAGENLTQEELAKREAEGEPLFEDASAGDNAAGSLPYDAGDSAYFREHPNLLVPFADRVDGKDKGSPFSIENLKSSAVPVAIGLAAAGATVAIQGARSRRAAARKAQTPARTRSLVKERSGLVKKAGVPKSNVGRSLPKTLGTGATRRPLTVQKVLARPLIKVPAVTNVAAKIPQAARLAGSAARIAGRVFLPLAIGLSAFDLAQRAQQKGAQNLTLQDVAAAGSGLGGLGLSKFIPAPIRGALGTKLSDIPQSVAVAAASNPILQGFTRFFYGGR